ncbi:hypothetical protein HNR03_001845 [Pseudomonas sp. JAI111]|uniref:hypothetical protein n=1 Tax=Pseudomonas sp. JAI111 TaxID=2735913 RepID=UPI002169D38C|nr:hypothetical protein [Pseudomonas sp. JAI111]MCS3837247.1 hypothetical protein [Pseudomonas sp. JAI111]
MNSLRTETARDNNFYDNKGIPSPDITFPKTNQQTNKLSLGASYFTVRDHDSSGIRKKAARSKAKLFTAEIKKQDTLIGFKNHLWKSQSPPLHITPKSKLTIDSLNNYYPSGSWQIGNHPPFNLIFSTGKSHDWP